MTNPPACASGSSSARRSKGWDQVLDDFLEAEELGFDHAWLVDHLVDTDGSPEDGCHEAWTLLAAIAAKTTRIRLGVLVSSNTFRHPAILLKEAVTVDHISGGRLVLGIGTGWHEDEHRRYGIDLPPAPERVDRFEEAVEVISLLMGRSGRPTRVATTSSTMRASCRARSSSPGSRSSSRRIDPGCCGSPPATPTSGTPSG